MKANNIFKSTDKEKNLICSQKTTHTKISKCKGVKVRMTTDFLSRKEKKKKRKKKLPERKYWINIFKVLIGKITK